MTKTYVGLDVGPDQLDVMVSCESGPWQVSHDETGIATIWAQRAVHHPDWIVIEATVLIRSLLVFLFGFGKT